MYFLEDLDDLGLSNLKAMTEFEAKEAEKNRRKRMEIETEMGRYEVTPFGIFLETWDGNKGVKRECILPRDRFVEAYEKWIKNAPTERENSMEEKEAYEKGANDAWELARKLILEEDKGGIYGDLIIKIFDMSDEFEVLEKQSALEALKAWNKYRNEPINVGDEVRCIDKSLGLQSLIVTHIYRDYSDEGKFDALRYDGCVCPCMTLNLWEKTGKHVDLSFIKEVKND